MRPRRNASCLINGSAAPLLQARYDSVTPTLVQSPGEAIAYPQPTVLCASVAAVVKGAAKSMFLSKMKTATVLLLILASGTGVGTLGHRVLAQRPQAAEPPARIADTKPTNAEFQKRKQSRLDLYGDPLPEGTVTR